MTNNDVIRRIRYTLNFKDKKIQSIFSHVEQLVTIEQVQGWLLRDEDEKFTAITDEQLAHFLNGLIIEKRGKKDGVIPTAEQSLNYNLILLKLKIAFNLQAEDILSLLQSAELTISKPELSAFFRKPDHKHYRQCKAQILRKFLIGLQFSLRPQAKDSAKHSVPANKKSYKQVDNKGSKPQKAATPKQRYINPNATAKVEDKADKADKRKVLKLKPNQIWKDHQ